MRAADPSRVGRSLQVTAVVGVWGGVVLALVTEALSQSNIAGPGWSLRGNGALIVPFAGGPALLAGGWVGLVERFRPNPDWLRRAATAAVLTLVLALFVGFGPVMVGPASPLLVSAMLALVTPLLALVAGLALVGELSRQILLPAVAICLLAISVSIAVPFVQFILGPLLLPIVLATPSLARVSPKPPVLVAALLALPVALVLGLFAGQWLTTRLAPPT